MQESLLEKVEPPPGAMPWWQILNVTGVDAALIAAAWLVAFAHALDAQPPAGSGLVLGLSVWLVYTGDRWLDARGRHWRTLPTRRHRFAARWHQELLVIGIAAFALDVVLALVALPRAQLVAGGAVLAGCIAHTWLAQGRPASWASKEARVALLFAAGLGMFFVGTPLDARQATCLLIALTVFGLAVLANCALIGSWETRIDAALGRARGPRRPTLRILAWGTAVAGLVAGRWFPPAWALGGYGVFLGVMDAAAWPTDLETRRSLADGALLVLGATMALT